MTWGDHARKVIARTLAALPVDAPLAEKKAALKKAYPFGERAYHPYKVWLACVKHALSGETQSGPAKGGKLDETEIMPAMREWAAKNNLIKKS